MRTAPEKPPVIEPLPAFKDVSAPERQQLFIKKLQLCAWPMDFADQSDVREKEIKRQSLLEIMDYINNTKNVFNEQTFPEIIQMIAQNLFRGLAPASQPVRGRRRPAAAPHRRRRRIAAAAAPRIAAVAARRIAAPPRCRSARCPFRLARTRRLGQAHAQYDPEEDEPVLEPAWPHLQYVYEFLLRFVVSNETDPKVRRTWICPWSPRQRLSMSPQISP